MKILSLNNHGSAIGYYRHVMPARALRELGHEVFCNESGIDYFKYIQQSTGLKADEWLFKHGPEYDVCHSTYTNVQDATTYVVALRNHAWLNFEKELPIIMDIDDDPMNVPSYNIAFSSYTGQAPSKKTVLLQTRTSDAITVTKQEIADSLRDEGKNFEVLPNYCEPSDWDHFPVRPDRDADKAVYIMYAGGPGHLGDLKQLEDSAKVLTKKYDGTGGKPLLRWIFVGQAPDWAADWIQDQKNPKNNRAFLVQGCDIKTFHQAIRWLSPDIFVAPVEHNVFNASKSCIKAYDAVTANAAFVCQDWDTYAEVPDDVCFKVRGDTQWLETLSELIENASLRSKYSAKLRKWVLDERQISDHITEWVSVYEAALKRPVIKELSDIVRPHIIRPDKI